MKIKKRNNGYLFVEWTDDAGKRCRRSLGTKDAREAAALASEVIYGTISPPAPRGKHAPTPAHTASDAFTLKDLFRECYRDIWKPEKVRSMPTIHSNTKILLEEFGEDTPITDIAYHMIRDKGLEWETSGRWAAATINRKMYTLKRALRYAHEDLMDKNGVPRLPSLIKVFTVPERNTKDRTLTAEEEDAALAYIRSMQKGPAATNWRVFEALFIFLVDTGARQGEALNVTCHHITGGRVSFDRYTTKTGKPRRLPLTARFIEYLPFLTTVAGRGDRPLFTGFDANKTWRYWRAVRDNVAGLDDVNVHLLRHTCGTRLAEGGAELWQISRWLGHSNMNTTKERYVHLVDENEEATLSLLEKGRAKHQGLRVVSSR